ncbi:hypothetical protein [Sinorhizobium sp. GL28]|uniref:hypothetical protein n=1 Tax=Sinorhizobium sp. GL28 TaxID=1358418 RepID=UPI0007276CF0|nr:hypothetical protein N184_35645 [Sinorhizobium sp. GL28]
MWFRHTLRSVAAIAIADPDLSLRDIAPQLDQMGERPVRGSTRPAISAMATKPKAIIR